MLAKHVRCNVSHTPPLTQVTQSNRMCPQKSRHIHDHRFTQGLLLQILKDGTLITVFVQAFSKIVINDETLTTILHK